jgi:acylphosphatase
MARVTRRVRVRGRVQGVSFRAWVCEEARQLRVHGWVWNLGDGSIEVHLEGEMTAVDQLIEKMRQGPPGAHVEELQVCDAQAERLSSFEIRH